MCKIEMKQTFSNKAVLIILLSSILFGLIVQKSISFQERINTKNNGTFNNPLYPMYTTLAKKYGLNLSFTQKVWEQRGPREYKVNEIFHQNPKSIDILFIGDSAVAWGLIPQVIEQMTGKKVAMYAYSANVLTEATAKLYNKLATYYLKDDGIVILSFDNINKERNPDYVSMSVEQYREIMSWKDEDFGRYADEINPNFYETYVSYKAFNKLYEKYTAYLKEQFGLELKSPSLYADYVEAYINPALYKSKKTNENKKTKFLRWDMRTITEYNPEYQYLSMPNRDMPPKHYVNEKIQKNALAANTIYAKDKIYMVNLYNNLNAYLLSRAIYLDNYKKLGFKLCDLGIMLEDNKHFVMQENGSYLNSLTHMGNEGGLMKSILVAQWLQSYYAKRDKF